MSKQSRFYDSLAPEEKQLLDFFRNNLQWGEATVVVKRGVPVFIKTAMKDIKLD